MCSDTDGGFECSCPSGFSGDIGINQAAICQNINECELETNPCSQESYPQTCFDTLGGYVCSCGTGYSGASGSNTDALCEDINECSSNPCDETTQVCVNSEGGFQCECGAGYQVNWSIK